MTWAYFEKPFLKYLQDGIGLEFASILGENAIGES